MTCPSCNSSRVYRSRARNIFEKAAHALLPLHYYRCHKCNWRGARFQKRTVNLTLVIVLALVVGFLAYELASPLLRLVVHIMLAR